MLFPVLVLPEVAFGWSFGSWKRCVYLTHLYVHLRWLLSAWLNTILDVFYTFLKRIASYTCLDIVDKGSTYECSKNYGFSRLLSAVSKINMLLNMIIFDNVTSHHFWCIFTRIAFYPWLNTSVKRVPFLNTCSQFTRRAITIVWKCDSYYRDSAFIYI